MSQKILEWRERLTNLSWYMKFLNEYIARKANEEDGIKGRFWESRFKSQALLDETAILSAMAYVDLNPIRAGIAKTPETSEYTSLYERIKYLKRQMKGKGNNQSLHNTVDFLSKCDKLKQPPQLMAFANGNDIEQSKIPLINFNLSEYLLLVELTGRTFRDTQYGKIPDKCKMIFERLNMKADGWFEMVKGLKDKFSFAVGPPILMAAFGAQNRAGSLKGTSTAKRVYQERTLSAA
jgi:hypothetical protein